MVQHKIDSMQQDDLLVGSAFSVLNQKSIYLSTNSRTAWSPPGPLPHALHVTCDVATMYTYVYYYSPFLSGLRVRNMVCTLYTLPINYLRSPCTHLYPVCIRTSYLCTNYILHRSMLTICYISPSSLPSHPRKCLHA